MLLAHGLHDGEDERVAGVEALADRLDELLGALVVALGDDEAVQLGEQRVLQLKITNKGFLAQFLSLTDVGGNGILPTTVMYTLQGGREVVDIKVGNSSYTLGCINDHHVCSCGRVVATVVASDHRGRPVHRIAAVSPENGGEMWVSFLAWMRVFFWRHSKTSV